MLHLRVMTFGRYHPCGAHPESARARYIAPPRHFTNARSQRSTAKACDIMRAPPRPPTHAQLDDIPDLLPVRIAMRCSRLRQIRHDLPRPTTMVKLELGDTLVEAYAGADKGVQTMKASEWEPFVRTMPHSEYPSTSSCLCQVYLFFVDLKPFTTRKVQSFL